MRKPIGHILTAEGTNLDAVVCVVGEPSGELKFQFFVDPPVGNYEIEWQGWPKKIKFVGDADDVKRVLAPEKGTIKVKVTDENGFYWFSPLVRVVLVTPDGLEVADS